MEKIFDPDRISAQDGVPEYFCHGPRMIELMPGDMLRVTLCRDQLRDVDGVPPFSVPVAVLNIPVACFLWNVNAMTTWAFRRSLLKMRPVGPVSLEQTFSPLLMQ
jgi:hypothetical protein